MKIMIRVVALLYLFLPSLSWALPEKWTGVWDGSEAMGIGYFSAVLEFVEKDSGLFAFKLMSDESVYVFSFEASDIEEHEPYFEISFSNILDGEASENIGFKLLLMPESGAGKIEAVLIMYEKGGTFVFPMSFSLIKPEDEKSELRLYERIAPYKDRIQ